MLQSGGIVVTIKAYVSVVRSTFGHVYRALRYSFGLALRSSSWVGGWGTGWGWARASYRPVSVKGTVIRDFAPTDRPEDPSVSVDPSPVTYLLKTPSSIHHSLVVPFDARCASQRKALDECRGRSAGLDAPAMLVPPLARHPWVRRPV